MPIRTDINLDEEINIFDDEDWDFMSVVAEKSLNYQYFNDIRDDEFTGGFVKILKTYWFPVSILIILLSLCAFVIFKMMPSYKDNQDYANVSNLSSVNEKEINTRIDGVVANSDVLVGCTKTMNEYISILTKAENYRDMDNLCETSSTFSSNYYTNTDKVKKSFDEYDCYARLIRELGVNCDMLQVNEVIQVDDEYYAYIDLSLPTDKSIQDYIHTLTYNITKEFNNGSNVSEASVIQFILDSLKTAPIRYESKEYCIKFNQDLKIIDDTPITSQFLDSYKKMINGVVTVIGGNIVQITN